MVQRSQNGWPIVGRDAIDDGPINGHYYPNGFLKGDVKKAFVWLFTQLNNRVEKVSVGSPADEWGWYVKTIEGSTTPSNHGSGTAGDYNASEHPMGATHSGYTATQENEINKILGEARGIFRWGWHYSGRKDPMHFEIDATPAEVHAFIVSLEKDDDMTLKEFIDALNVRPIVPGSLARSLQIALLSYPTNKSAEPGDESTLLIDFQHLYDKVNDIDVRLTVIEGKVE